MPEGRGIARRDLLFGAVGAVTATWAVAARAEEPDLPSRLQIELLAKVIAYDRGFRRRAGQQALTAILMKKGDPDSERSARELLAELGRLATLNGLAHREIIYELNDISDAAARVRAERPAIVYSTPGLSSQVTEVGRSLVGIDVLSVSAVAGYVKLGVVLGFGLKSGKPRLVVNLTQARKQYVDFSADMLRVAEVIS